MEAREKGRAAAGRGGVRGCGGGEAAAETQVKGEGGGRVRRLRLRRGARRSDGRPAMRRRRHGVGGRAAAPWPQLGGNRSWFKLPMLSSQQASYVSEDQQHEEDDGDGDEVLIPGLPARFTYAELEEANREFFKPLTMAADRFLHFASLVSVVVLAAGSRSPGGVAALPRRGQLVDGGDNDKNKCVYMLYYMGTGWIWKAGTDAAIGVELTAADGSGFAVRDLERWGGLMGAEHDYYERATAASPADRRTSSPRVTSMAAPAQANCLLPPSPKNEI
uniref:Uncharacterized protein n=1 Tax=Oryza sativa subsp. japonica TaxID=39947 RepID=Q69TF9_ORYSJ|nr:hypothetical protein [Oryza sativa Japonica Group]